MELNEYCPDFSLSAEGEDITQVIKRGLAELHYTDNGAATKQADELVITLFSETLSLPPKGALLRLGLGFNGKLVNKGTFTVCQVASSGPPRRITVSATSAPMNASKHGADVTALKNRAFSDITLGDLVKTIATENNLVARVSPALAKIRIPWVMQSSESDASLLSRLAAMYGATSKPTNGYWLFLEYGASQSPSGRDAPALTITPDMVSGWSYTEGERGGASGVSGEKKGKVGVRYFEQSTGRTREHTVDVESTDKRHPFTQADKGAAEHSAQAKVRRVQKSGRRMTITLPCRPALLKAGAEMRFITQGFGVREDHNWQAESVEFSLVPGQGFTLNLSLSTDISAKGQESGKKKADKKGVNYYG
ncbi:contractile injection system protein, VgrG/Pvc8 family [Escherichia albertii]|uniref:contractile injection system protein, VgrG/Pvc8 family n=1 Tax=Escherichia albertii TaxID=208962 RepID=UPI000CF6BE52|nr:contractile injection system protein, VgrG/Pvc8 family [Escherichia albertii]EFB5187740.1 late control protein [Escherichia albertii]EJI9010404.1 late control protein [Escherichia albertii]MCZ9131680.1 contractile injection system protein, VgrG/Pvc8 family [Escherichia albertii]